MTQQRLALILIVLFILFAIASELSYQDEVMFHMERGLFSLLNGQNK